MEYMCVWCVLIMCDVMYVCGVFYGEAYVPCESTV